MNSCAWPALRSPIWGDSRLTSSPDTTLRSTGGRVSGPVCHRPPGRELGADFFAHHSDVVAPRLLGKILWREGVGGGRITEVEAYLPVDDPACHAFRGPTLRNKAMFGPPGSLYVYLSYGIHVLLNLVCDRESVGSAVLVRSFEPIGDTTVLRANRGAPADGSAACCPDGFVLPPLASLSCGPGRVGQALGLSLDMDGCPLGGSSGLYVIDDGYAPSVEAAARIGITKGKGLPLRFFAADNAFVTRSRCMSGGARDETG